MFFSSPRVAPLTISGTAPVGTCDYRVSTVKEKCTNGHIVYCVGHVTIRLNRNYKRKEISFKLRAELWTSIERHNTAESLLQSGYKLEKNISEAKSRN